MNIQWFPGHMVKAQRQISENLKKVDAVCEIIDSRIPLSSRNPDLDRLIASMPRLVVLNRVDLADPMQTKKWVANLRDLTTTVIIETDCKSGKGVQQLAGAARLLLAEKITHFASKGQTGRQIRLMVVGIPNVGKSSFINKAVKRKKAPVSDRPGVTRGQQWIKLGGGIELLDTPGVLWPKFEDQTVAENLAFTGAIRDEIMDVETLGARLLTKLAGLYPLYIKERYKIDLDDDGFVTLENAAKKRGFLASGGEVDTERMAIILLDEFRAGVLGRITLEWI